MRISRQVVRRFAETMLFWRGRLQAREVQDFAGVSERTARNLLSEWRTTGLLPPYRAGAERCLVPVEDFDPGSFVTDPVIAFSQLLIAHNLPGNPFALCALPGGGHDLSLTASVPSGPIRELVAACLGREAVSLIYAAKTGRQEFVFSPSALVRARGRYHLRGHRADGRDALGERLHERYVDVVPARTIEAWRMTEAPFIGLENDDDWHAFEERRFVLSPDLSEEERICHEHEYGISETGEFRVRKRRALMPYVLQELSERRCWRRDGTSVRLWETEDATGGCPGLPESGNPGIFPLVD